MARGWPGRTRILERGWRSRTAGRFRARGIRRPWRRFPPRHGGDRPASEAWRRRLRRQPAQHSDPALSGASWHRRAEEEIPAQTGDRRTGQRDRDDRAGGRIGPPEHHHHCAQGWQWLPYQRGQDLYLERPDGGFHHRRRQDRSERARQGHLADAARDRGRRRLPARQEARQGRDGRGGYLRTLLRRCLRARASTS